MMKPSLHITHAWNAGLLLMGLQSGCKGTVEDDRFTCELRACDWCVAVQCFDDDGKPPPEGWYPNESCMLPASLERAEVCGVQFCCVEVKQ